MKGTINFLQIYKQKSLNRYRVVHDIKLIETRIDISFSPILYVHCMK